MIEGGKKSKELKSEWITSIFINPVKEKIHSSNFRYLIILPMEPQNLLTPVLHCFTLGKKGGAIIPFKKQETYWL